MMEEKIERTINNIIQLFKKDSYKWKNERMIHYDFFKLLFDEFTSEEIKDNFRWELLVGPPSYAKGSKPAAVDMAMYIDKDKFIAIEIESVGPGVDLQKELEICIKKLQSTQLCKNNMVRGYIVPLLARDGSKIARGYSMTYFDLCNKILIEAENSISDSRIELVKEGIILT